ncbi:MAG: bifunctional transaldolase/phosoglucose isomerase [Chloroflexi bacterium]|nr:bifunctional transaldolase/phosoglucose isomerase [Chloroflexota bacterium]
MMDKFATLSKIGQSIWYDNIQRDLLEDGTIERYVNAGIISGITSNPSIFKKAILSSLSYQQPLKTMAWAGWNTPQIYENLVVEDIQKAADYLLPTYKNCRRKDGFVSLEVDPRLAYDTNATISEARRLWKAVDRTNLMIKIPATVEGIPAIRASIAAGINVNVTLIFSIERYRKVMDAYLSGLEDRLREGKEISGIASVASFFVSRFDTKIDKLLADLSTSQTDDLFGKAAIANARQAYGSFKRVFQGERFLALKKKGAQLQRPLWASTSTKNLDYRDVLYVEELIGADTVNTIPPVTLEAFTEHGKVVDKLSGLSTEEAKIVKTLSGLGIDLEEVATELEREGVQQFIDAFTEMMEALEDQRTKAVRELGPLQQATIDRVAILDRDQFCTRMFAKQADLWTKDEAGQMEAKIRLDWLEAPENGFSLVPELENLTKILHKEGYLHAVLIGMGGSSLAAEVMSKILGKQGNGLELRILDSTDPSQIEHLFTWAGIEKTIFLISSKSGGTAEVMAGFQYAWRQMVAEGTEEPGSHFIAVTDPGTSLQKLAEEHHFRAVFNADPNVGGRYSALTAFGLVPAALIGCDIASLLKSAQALREKCGSGVPAGRNPGLVLGAVLGEAYRNGRDKLTIITDQGWLPFGSWVEQLIAESSGKEGKGILPIDLEPARDATRYTQDRIFVYLRQGGEEDQRIADLKATGHPCLVLEVAEKNALVQEFYHWEFATATACAIIGVNAFDQPNVQDSKTRTKNKIKMIQETGKLEKEDILWEDESIQISSNSINEIKGQNFREILQQFLNGISPDSYVALNAFVERDENNQILLQNLRQRIGEQFGVATTLGFGPRFLHSTGQLHKGGKNNGYFIVITTTEEEHIIVPDLGITFEQLIHAQALGDIEALDVTKRKVLHIHLQDDDLKSLNLEFES